MRLLIQSIRTGRTGKLSSTLSSVSVCIFLATSFGTVATHTSAAMVVPERMFLTGPMKTAKWADVLLVPLDLTVGIMEGPAVTAKDAIAKHTGPVGSIAFVVRRPG